MSAFKGNANMLAQQYVYYKRLRTDKYYPRLGEYVKNASERILSQTEKKYITDASGVRAQAQAEFKKEKALLQSKFKVNIDFDYYGGVRNSREGFKQVIDALNAYLNLKDIYDRNIQLTKNTKGMKAVFSWYPTYFMHAWEEYWPEIKRAFERNFKKGLEASEALDVALDKYVPKVCLLGIQKMLDGPEVEHKTSMDPNLKDAYKALLSQIGEIQTEGSLANQIYKAYQLDELKNSLINEMQIRNKKIYAKDFKPKVKEMISKDIHSRGGYSLEAIETAIFQMVASGIDGGAIAIHSGSKGIKADNILTLSIDPSIIYEALEQAGANREENIKALSALGNKLSNLDDGFIIYSSDKNYSLNENFKGFSAAKTGKNAADFLNNLPKLNNSVSTLIGVIQQLGHGAMLAGKRAAFEQLLAQDVAYMLFDDFTTIGNFSSGGNAIHVMNLNGIMIPMSVILTLLADAIESLNEKEVRRIVNVKIKAPKILWETQDEQNKAFPSTYEVWNKPAWDYQRQWAIDNTTITATFLKDFKSLISQYL